VKQSYWQDGSRSGIAYTNTHTHTHTHTPRHILMLQQDAFHQQQTPEILVNAGPWCCPEFSCCSSKNWAGQPGCVCLCFFSSPTSCSSAMSTRPPSSHQTRGTQPCCHSAQAPQQLRFPLGLTEVFAVSHIVGIQHQPVYWSPCGFSLSLSPLLSLSLFFLFPQHTFFTSHT